MQTDLRDDLAKVGDVVHMSEGSFVCVTRDSACALEICIETLHRAYGRYIFYAIDPKEPKEQVELPLGEHRAREVHQDVQRACLETRQKHILAK